MRSICKVFNKVCISKKKWLVFGTQCKEAEKNCFELDQVAMDDTKEDD